MRGIFLFVRSLRVHQWVKNGFIVAPTIFSLQFLQFDYLKNSVAAVFLFSLVTGSIYIFNDCFDKRRDQLHPEKKMRPIASGQLAVPGALVGASLLLAAAMVLIYLFNSDFFVIAAIYMGLNLAYSIYLKKVVILDIMIIAAGFVLRVEIGGVINDIDLSRWILIITFLGASLLALIKRRQELLKMAGVDNQKVQTRLTLQEYNLPLLDQLISISTSTTLISYIIYVLDPGVKLKFGTGALYLTVPFVLFGIFRYLYLTYSKGMGENPAEVIFGDLAFTLNIILWVAVFILLII